MIEEKGPQGPFSFVARVDCRHKNRSRGVPDVLPAHVADDRRFAGHVRHVARKMFELISGEPREVIVQAFVEGAGLAPKGAQTYFYNCKRKAAKSA